MAVEDKVTIEDTLNRIRGVIEAWYDARDTAYNSLRTILVESMDHIDELNVCYPTDPEIELQEEEDMRNGRGHYEKI